MRRVGEVTFLKALLDKPAVVAGLAKAHESQYQMSIVYKPPQPLDGILQPSLFLAGTIDNGDSYDWQKEIERKLAHKDLAIINPRRDEWNSSLEQSIHNPQFKEQVEWELQGLEMASVIYMYFAPDSKSPITLLELGLFAHSGKIVVVSPIGFWRRGNVEVVCSKYGIPLFDDAECGLEEILHRLS